VVFTLPFAVVEAFVLVHWWNSICVCFGGSRHVVSSMDSRGPPPETSNFYCLPGRAGGTPNVLEVRSSNHRTTAKQFYPTPFLE
jgi:hypothetical protein